MASEQKQELNEQQIQNLFNKGFAAFERGSLDMAVELLTRCVEVSPGFDRARKFLRAAEVQKALKKGRGKLQLIAAELAGAGALLQAQTLKGTKPEAALMAAEKMMAAAPLSRKYGMAYADIAIAAGRPEAGVMTLEALLEQWPDDVPLLVRLADLYQATGEWRKSRDCYNNLLRLDPRNPDIVKGLKEAEARLTVKAGGWEEATDTEGKGGKDDFRKLIRDKDQAKTLDMQNKSVVGGSDADALIE